MSTFFRRRYMREELKGVREIYVGIFILLLTGGVCVALVVHSRMPGRPLFEVSQEYVQRSEDKRLAAAQLPELNLADWSAPRDVKTFSPDTLYEKINGRADLYLQFHFKQLTFAKYLRNNDPDQDIQVWLFDMSAAKNALGIYQAEITGHPDPVDVGEAGYRSGPSIFFWKGPLYVSVMTIDESFSGICLLLAEKIADSIAADETLDWAELVLPQENMVAGSREFLASDVFSLDFLNDIHLARYSYNNDEEYRLFVHRADSAEQAGKLLEDYLRFFEEYGSVLSNQDGVIVGDGGGVIDAVFVFGRYLCGASEVVDLEHALRYAGRFRQHLLELGNRLP